MIINAKFKQQWNQFSQHMDMFFEECWQKCSRLAQEASFKLDKALYGIAAASYSAISSSGSSEDSKAAEEGTALKVAKSLAPFEMTAMIFQRRDATA